MCDMLVMMCLHIHIHSSYVDYNGQTRLIVLIVGALPLHSIQVVVAMFTQVRCTQNTSYDNVCWSGWFIVGCFY